MPWCHTCRLENAAEAGACSECGGVLLDRSPPERRIAPLTGSPLRVVATLPPEEALVASGRLDARGIPATLRRVEESQFDGPFHVLVDEEHLARARASLSDDRRDRLRLRVERAHGRDPARTRTLLFMLVFTAIALGLSALLVLSRWLLSGSPLPR